MNSILKKTSAWVPIVMSVCALGLLFVYVLIFGISQKSQDEGLAARLYQLLIFGQLPFIAYFIFTWVPKMPKKAVIVVLLQIAAIVITFIPLYILE